MPYRLKNSTIQAIQYEGTEDSSVAIQAFLDQKLGVHDQMVTPKVPALTIQTAKGMEACIAGDWVIKTAAGVSILTDKQFKTQYEEIA